MKRLIITLSFILIVQNIFAQTSLPNANIPLPMMVPVKHRKPVLKVTIQKKDCDKLSKLISFHLPCCIQIDSMKSIKEIATIEFDSSGCKIPEVHFAPAVLIASNDFETIQVTATAGEEKITTKINVIKLANKQLKKSVSYSFEEEAEQYKAMMERLKNNSEPAAETSGNTFPTGDLSYTSTFACCDSNTTCFVENKKFEGSYIWDFEITAHVPLYGIPVTRSLDGIIIGLASLKATIPEETNCNKKEPCLSINGEVSIGGKVSRQLPENIIASDIRLQTKIDYYPDVCNSKEQKINTQKFSCQKMDIKGTITSGWGLVTHSFDYSMYSTKKNKK